MFSLQGKVALVTGAGAVEGIGFASARALKDCGAELWICATSDRIYEDFKFCCRKICFVSSISGLFICNFVLPNARQTGAAALAPLSTIVLAKVLQLLCRGADGILRKAALSSSTFHRHVATTAAVKGHKGIRLQEKNIR